MKNIIVVGYPKSGNTWITRLVAELVNCPVVGFWNSDCDEIAREGFNRKSDIGCFKSHHQFHELAFPNHLEELKIIYAIRDPRDLAISGAHYFDFERYPAIRDIFKRLPKGIRIYNKTLKKALCSEQYRLDQMIQTILYGSEHINYFCRIPWKEHYKPYLERGCFLVKYEDLLANAEYECEKILTYLGVQRQSREILEAIENQSFEKKKAEFLKNGEIEKAFFLRSGKVGQWQEKLSQKQKQLFLSELSEDLSHFSYPI
jgi:hypothetical protein